MGWMMIVIYVVVMIIPGNGGYGFCKMEEHIVGPRK